MKAVEEDLCVGGFGEGVGGDGANRDVVESEFGEGLLKAGDDFDRLFDGGGENVAVAENVAPKGNIFFEKIDHFLPAIVGNGDDDHGGVARSNVDRGSHDRGRIGFVAHDGEPRQIDGRAQ